MPTRTNQPCTYDITEVMIILDSYDDSIQFALCAHVHVHVLAIAIMRYSYLIIPRTCTRGKVVCSVVGCHHCPHKSASLDTGCSLTCTKCTAILSDQVQLGLHKMESCSEIVQCPTAAMSFACVRHLVHKSRQEA